MRRLGFGFIIAGIFLFTIFLTVTLFNNAQGMGALKVSTNVKGKVYLNDVPIGEAPLCKCEGDDLVKKGTYTIKIVPNDKNFAPFSHKIKVEKGVLTMVERIFLPGSLSSAFVLTLEKVRGNDSQLMVISIPDEAIILLDGQPQGVTPFLYKKIQPGEHEIEINKQGYSKKSLKVQIQPSYKLIVNAILGAELKTDNEPTPTPQPSPSGSPSGTPAPSAGPTSAPKATTIQVLKTPNGFLRVREEPSTTAKELIRINTGDKYPKLDEETGWVKIKVSNTLEGWVSSTYVEDVVETTPPTPTKKS